MLILFAVKQWPWFNDTLAAVRVCSQVRYFSTRCKGREVVYAAR